MDLGLHDIADRFLAGKTNSVSDLRRLYNSPNVSRYLTYDEVIRLFQLLQSKGILVVSHSNR